MTATLFARVHSLGTDPMDARCKMLYGVDETSGDKIRYLQKELSSSSSLPKVLNKLGYNRPR